MEVSMTTLLVTLWMKTLLNWLVLVVQRGHVGRSFWGVFCVSLALGDALLHLSVTCVFLLQDVSVFGLHVTKYHVCAAVQAACSVQGVLHWPVFILSGLDVLWSTRRPGSARAPVHGGVVLLLWTLPALYVLTAPDSHPLTGNEDTHVTLRLCYLTGEAQSRQVAWAALLAPVVVTCYLGSLTERVRHFLSTWSCFLCLLIVILASGTEVPPYLDMNGVWLCFIHSLHSAVAQSSCGCFFCAHTQDDTWQRQTRDAHVCVLSDKSGLTAGTLPVRVLLSRRLA